MRKRPFVKADKGMLLGYAHVSKGDEQSNAVQFKALRAAGCRRIFEEAASGGRWERPDLHRMLDQLREVDVVVVWKLDRLSRSLKDVLHIMERIGETGAGFRSITEAIDTTTPAEEARSGQAPRNRRERHLRPLDRRRDGAALQHQRADRVTYRRHAPRGVGLEVGAIDQAATAAGLDAAWPAQAWPMQPPVR